MSEVWVHNLSPFLLEISDGFGLRWYGLSYLSGFLSAYLIVDYLTKKGSTQLTREQVPDFITYAAIGTLLGGRLGYTIFYSPDLILKFSSSFPFWGLLEVHKGGMASHGGLGGIILACMLYAWKKDLIKAHLVDLCTFGGTIGVFFGRIANFINGELYGRECSDKLWYAVKFPKEIYTWGVGEISKLKALGPAVEALGEITTSSGEKIKTTAVEWNSWLNGIGVGWQGKVDAYKDALVKAAERGNSEVTQAMGVALTPRYPSQLIESFLEGTVVFVVLMWYWRKPRKPGMLLAIFGLTYSVVRVIGEQFRLPDHGIGFDALGLTRGQWLSVAMFVACLVYLYFVNKSQAKPIGGWAKEKF